MNATIITIGDEILIGQIVDTNAVSISQKLNSIGVVVRERLSIGDTREAIRTSVERAMEQCDIVIITGGLGPTKDDITKKCLCDMFGGEWRRDEAVAHHVKTMLEARGVVYNELNHEQSLVPASCEVLFNDHGTAPGMWFERDGKVVVSLPGVPFEMEHLMIDRVLPRITARFALRAIVHRTLITAGLPESMLAARIEPWESALPEGLKLAYLPGPGRVRLRLSAYEVDGDSVLQQINEAFAELEAMIPEHIVGYDNTSMEQLVHDALLERSATLAVAESCTGGSIASKFCAMAGASAYMLCGVVAYSNQAKMDVLGVSAETLEEYGAVSEQVACQMAEGVRRISGADYAVATTGIAGPTGGSELKPVGTVWIGISTAERTFAVLKMSGTERSQVIDRATAYSIELLRAELK